MAYTLPKLNLSVIHPSFLLQTVRPTCFIALSNTIVLISHAATIANAHFFYASAEHMKLTRVVGILDNQ